MIAFAGMVGSIYASSLNTKGDDKDKDKDKKKECKKGEGKSCSGEKKGCCKGGAKACDKKEESKSTVTPEEKK